MVKLRYDDGYHDGYIKGVRDGSKFAVAMMKKLGVEEVVLSNEDVWFADRRVIEVVQIAGRESIIRYREV